VHASVTDSLPLIACAVYHAEHRPRQADSQAGHERAVLAHVRCHQPAQILAQCADRGQPEVDRLPLDRFALLDERDVPPGVRAQATGVVIGHPGEVEPVVGDAVPFLAGDLAGLTTDAHAGVGEEPVPRTWILVTGLEVGHRRSPQAFAAPATATATAGTRRSSNTLGTIFLGSA